MKKPTITIVIPAYNEAKRIADCLDAIAAQKVTPKQVILVDNNSTDATVEKARKYAFVTVIHEKKQGIVYARNAGFNAATSDVIARIDADTILEPNWTSVITKFYEKNTGAVSGSSYFYNVPARRLAQTITNFLLYRVDKAVSGFHTLWGSNMAISRDLWLKIRDETCIHDIHEDHDLANHVHAAGGKITYLPKLVAGVEMKAGFMGAKDTWHYLALWPRMQRRHHVPGARLLWFVIVPMWVFHWVPVLARRIVDLRERRWFALDSR